MERKAHRPNMKLHKSFREVVKIFNKAKRVAVEKKHDHSVTAHGRDLTRLFPMPIMERKLREKLRPPFYKSTKGPQLKVITKERERRLRCLLQTIRT
jgi:hypothetical protein